LFERKDNKKESRIKLPYALVVILGLSAGLFFLIKMRPTHPNALAVPVAQAEPAKNPSFQARLSNSQTPASTPSPVAAAVPAPVPPTQTAPAVTPPVTNTASATAAIPNVPPAHEMGRLAVSSAVPAEIYLGSKNLGSTPTTVQLPVGRQTLEYRHGDLRTTATHEIRPNATTSATVTFQTTVQINANPWAQVFLDGATRRSLGQTPLSGVAVPIGGVLVFENPNFPSKSYRITDKDSAVQVNFP
jgi:cytoskeletal protein RodZ